jgi:signal transduction histidine kinase
MAYQFGELVDLKRIKELMQLFFELTGFPSTLTDPAGNIIETADGDIVGVGWKRICLDYHRVHPTTKTWCVESDVLLSRTASDGGGAACYQCLNGMVDAASPVVIDGQHIVNLFTGQFFNEPPDEQFFRERARRFGFDEEAYVATLKEVPVFPREFVERGLSFLDMLAGLLAESGLRQKGLLELNQEIEGRVRERTAELLAANTALKAAKETAERAERLAAERAAELERREEELARLNDRLTDLDRAKSEFFSNVSHEFRTPLTLILGPVEKLLGEAPSEALRHPLEVVRKNAYTLLKHVNDLLDVARLDAGQVDLRYRQTDLAQSVRHVSGHFEMLAAEKGIRFETHAPPCMAAELDADKVERIILNLLSNAFKYTPDGGTIRCCVEARGSARAVIRVEDSGVGIRPELREAMFERFRQGEGRGFGGAGLGLAIAKEFATLHGGSIAVVDSPGGGALFEVELPLEAPQGWLVEPAEDGPFGADAILAEAMVALTGELCGESDDVDPRPTGRPLALVVEDNSELRRFVAQVLEADFAVATARDGEEGLRKALALRPDVIVTDIMMPRMSGDRMVAALRAQGPLDDPPVLVLSAKADDALRVKLLRSGAQDYLVKPFVAEELRARAVNLFSITRARVILQRALDSRDRDLAALAEDIAEKKGALQRSCAEMRVAREQAEAADRAKSRFLAMVSHELRSPLQNLELYVELLRRRSVEPGGTADLAKLIGALDTASKRMTQIVTTILQYSSIERGRLDLTVVSVNLEDVVAEVVGELAGRAGAKGLALVTRNVPGPLPPLTTDPDLLRLVLVNLVDNAVKYTAHGSVAISLGCDGGRHRCTVTDTGAGIRAEDQARIFEPFQQLEEVDHKHTPGIGLGLALVKNAVDMLGGSILLESEAGRGSAFSIILPSRWGH